MTCNYSIYQRIGITDSQADQFPFSRWTEKIVGTLTATKAYPVLKFPGCTNFDVTLLYPNAVWSDPAEPGCLMGDWPEGSQIEFRAYKDSEGFWSKWRIYNPEMSNGIDFPGECIRTTALGLIELLGSGTQPAVVASTTDPNLSRQEYRNNILALSIEERKRECERRALENGHTITSWTLEEKKEGYCWDSNRCLDENCIAWAWVADQETLPEDFQMIGGLAITHEHGHPFCAFDEEYQASLRTYTYRKSGEIRINRLST